MADLFDQVDPSSLQMPRAVLPPSPTRKRREPDDSYVAPSPRGSRSLSQDDIELVRMEKVDVPEPETKGWGQTIKENFLTGVETSGAGLSAGLNRDPSVIASDITDTKQYKPSAEEEAYKRRVQETTKAFDEDKSIANGLAILGNMAKSPKMVAGEVARSFGQSMPAIGGAGAGAGVGALAGGPAGALVGGLVGYVFGNFATNTQAEIAGSLEEKLAKNGVDTNDPAALYNALARRPDWLKEARERGLKRGAATTAAETAVDLATFGAGKFMKPATSTIGRAVKGGGIVGAQGVQEGVGNIAADVASGDPVSYGESLYEGAIGAIAGVPEGAAAFKAGQALRKDKDPGSIPADGEYTGPEDVATPLAKGKNPADPNNWELVDDSEGAPTLTEIDTSNLLTQPKWETQALPNEPLKITNEPAPTDVVNRNGRPFLLRSSAEKEAERTGGRVVPLGIGYVVKGAENDVGDAVSDGGQSGDDRVDPPGGGGVQPALPRPSEPGMDGAGVAGDAASAPAVQDGNGAEAVDQVTFTTAKGSVYTVNGTTTTRNKAARSDVGHEGDFGPKPTSQRTIYVDDAGANALSEVQAKGGAGSRRLEVLPDGKRAGLKYANGKDAGKFEGRTVTGFYEEPAVGLTPVEVWEDGRVVHFGNKITSVTKTPATVAQKKRFQSGTDFSGIDARANEAATSPKNDLPEPTDAQKEAGNYKKGHHTIAGLDVAIENPAGSRRRPEWPALKDHYGYFKRTTAFDGPDKVDVFVKPGTPDGYDGDVFIVDQHKTNGAFDEHKVMLGFDSEEDARAGYARNYSKGWKGGRDVTRMTQDEFKAWLYSDAPAKGSVSESRKPQWERAGMIASSEARGKLEKALVRGARVREGKNEGTVLEGMAEDGTLKIQWDRDKSRSVTRKPWGLEYKAAEQPTPAPAQRPPKPQNGNAVDPERDSMLTAIAKLGGLDRQQVLDEFGLDLKGLQSARSGVFGKPVFRKSGGRSIDDIRDRLQELGYLNPNDLNDLEAKISDGIAGVEHLTPQGMQARLDREAQEEADIRQNEADEEARLEREAIQSFNELDDDAINGLLAEAGNEEISDAALDVLQEAGRAIEDAERAAQAQPEKASGSRDAGSGEQGSGFLEAPTKQGLLAKAEAALRARKEKERRDAAPPPEEFRLTGSNSQADQAIAAGQMELVAAEPTVTARAEATLKPKPAAKGQSNKVFTAEKADAARKLLRERLKGSRLNSNLDPELIKAGIDLAGFHVEAGARKFAEYARAMVDDIGDAVRPYLKGWYLAVKLYPGFDAAGMDRASMVEDADLDAILNGPAADPMAAHAQAVAKHFADGNRFANIGEARRFVGDLMGRKQVVPGTTLAKQVDEIVELGIVMAARQIVQSDPDPKSVYAKLVNLYLRQPGLRVRTSTSVAQQAYSTPAPLAYIASRLSGADNGVVYEPTAGNGMLLIGTQPSNAIANELNPDRRRALEAQGFDPTGEDATTHKPAAAPDVVIANPPFGVIQDEGGTSKRFNVSIGGDSFATNEIDHAIAFKALAGLKDDGRAVLIVGGINKQVQSAENRADAYNGKAKRNFYFHLYKHFNVTDHFTVGGRLYEKQGVAWPVDVIVINGRGKSARPLPSVDAPRIYDDWASLRGPLDEVESRGMGAPRAEGAAGRARDLSPADRAADDGRVSGAARDSVPEPDQPGAGPAASDGRRNGRDGEGRADSGPARADSGGRSGVDADLQQPDAARRAGADRRGAGAVPDREGRPGSGPGTATGQEQVAPAGDRDGAGARPPQKPDDLGVNANQVEYKPASKSGAIGTLVPVNMQTPVREALERLAFDVGPLDAFVAEELGYKPEAIGRFFGAEQIDALALALRAMQNGAGFVIGDQTGIGKGRVVAGVIRWALKNGKTPIFVTEKPNLYGDMYRDLTDIGVDDIRPIMTNQSDRVPLNDEGTVTLKPLPRHNEKLAEMTAAGRLDDANMIFTTYSQMQFVKGEQTVRNRFLSAFANGGVVIFDESHNAGGQTLGRTNKKKGEEAGDKQGRAAFAREIAGAADSVFYSSATWAKRPEVMDLYFKTDMSKAVKGNVKALPAAIEAGGVPLQQAVSAMLTQTGQYIRRERSFNGVTYNTVETPVDKVAAEKISQVMMGVAEFDRLKKGAVKELTKRIRQEGEALGMDNSTGAGGATSTNFTSIMHNLIDQMLLSLKIEAAADMAIQRSKDGEKVVLTVANTMGSFIEQYVEAMSLSPGDAVGLSFKDLMIRYLDRSREVIIKPPGDGPKRRHRLTDEELGPSTAAHWNAVAQMIRESDELSTPPISPIDYLHNRLRKAGLKSGEITGRTHIINYGAAGGPAYETRKSADVSIAGRRKVIKEFNNGGLDVIVLNQAGSTGLSLHASEKFKDRRPRRMIIAQPEKNIDTHMQMLGRVHRTGQVVLPSYDQLVADIPAEKRPAAVLARKMASLNANTTANRNSALTSEQVIDFLNDYGDEVVAQIMEDMPDIHRMLGKPLAEDGDRLARMNAAAKATGRIPLLPVAQQEELYKLIEDSYKETIERADALGENMLEAKSLELDAKTVSKQVLVMGDGSGSPFGEAAYAETIDVKRLGKPYTSDQVRSMLRTELELEEGASDAAIERAGREKASTMLTDTRKAAGGFIEEQASDADTPEAQNGIRTRLAGLLDRWTAIASTVRVGASYRLTLTDGSTVMAVPVSIKRKKGVKTPFAMGSWQVQFAVADSSRSFTLPFSKITVGQEDGKIAVEPRARDPITGETAWEMFDSGQATAREKRVMLTGNLLAAFGQMKRGQIVNYRTSDGELRQGILMPRNFDIKKAAEDMPVLLSPEQVVNFVNLRPMIYATTGDGIGRITIGRDGGVELKVPKSKAEGGKYFLDPKLRAMGLEFVSRSSSMVVNIPRSMRGDALVRLVELGDGPFQAPSWRDEARSVGGKSALDQKPAFSRGGGRQRMPRSQVQAIVERMLKGVSQALRVVVVDGMQDENVPEVVRKADADDRARGAVGDVDGFIYRGVVYINAETMARPSDVARVFAHEVLGHFGLRGFFGEALDKVLDFIVVGRAGEVAAMVKRRGLTNDRVGRRTAAEEILAELSESKPQLNLVQRALAAIRTWLRKHGLDLSLSDAELVRDYILPARAWVERGGKGVMGNQQVAFQRVWHGSPYRGIERFSTDKIGTGEGAQAFGWGLYFASKRDVADGYRERLSEFGILSDGKRLKDSATTSEVRSAIQRVERLISYARGDLSPQEWAVEIRKMVDERAVDRTKSGANDPGFLNSERLISGVQLRIADLLENGKLTIGETGQLYEVSIPEDDEMLLWDKPLRDQPKAVREALQSIIDSDLIDKDSKPFLEKDKDLTGRKIYDVLSGLDAFAGKGPYGKAASDLLLANGIRGIKYLDGWSRGSGDGTYNYVIFSGDDAKVERAMFSRTESAARGREPMRGGLVDKILQVAGGRALSEYLLQPAWDRLIRGGRRIVPQSVQAALVSDYGLDDAYLETREESRAKINAYLRQAKSLIDMLAGLDREQSRVAYQWMTEKPDLKMEAQMMAALPPDSRAVLQAMKAMVHQMGRQAVDLGLISEETFKLNEYAYLHRSYLKHEAQSNRKGHWKQSADLRAENFKYRGLRHDVPMSRLSKFVSDLKKGEKLERWIRKDSAGRIRQIEYARPGRRPAELEGFESDGVWMARFVDQGKPIGMWRDLTKDERQKLGEIEEVRYAMAKTALQGIRDIEHARFLRWVARKYGRTAESVEADGIEVLTASAGYLLNRPYKPDEWVQVPTTKIPKSNIRRFGDLAGMVIPGPVWNDIRSEFMSRPEDVYSQTYDWLMRAWKISKTALSPAVHLNNVMANFIFADLADVRARDMAKAASTLIKAKRGDAASKAMLDRFKDSGAEQGSLVANELRLDVVEDLLKDITDQQEEEIGAIKWASIISMLAHGQVSNAYAGVKTRKELAAAKVPFEKMIQAYRLEDSFFRLAAFIQRVDQGETDLEAGRHARDAFLDYNINAPAIQAARRTFLPFIAFSYRAIPLLLKSAVQKPWKIAKYVGIFSALNAIAYAMLGDKGDEDKERRLLPEEKQGKMFGVYPRLMRMPWNDENDSPVFLDIRRWVPGGDMFDVSQSQAATPLPSWLSAGGPLALAMEFFLNKSSFTGRPIVLETDTPSERAVKVSDHIFKFMAPNLPVPNPIGRALEPESMNVPGVWQTYSWTSISNAGTGVTDAFGRERSLSQALASSVGLKVGSYPADVALRNNAFQYRAQRSEIRREISNIARQRQKGGMTDEQYDAKLDAQREKLRRINERLQERTQ